MIGDIAVRKMQANETCRAIGVVDRIMLVEDVGCGMAQLYDLDGKKISSPISHREANVYALWAMDPALELSGGER